MLAETAKAPIALQAVRRIDAIFDVEREVNGLSPEQRFFVGYAQWACESVRPETQRVLALTDAHSPGRYRVNGVVANIPEFAAAFACKPGAPMAPVNRCRVW